MGSRFVSRGTIDGETGETLSKAVDEVVETPLVTRSEGDGQEDVGGDGEGGAREEDDDTAGLDKYGRREGKVGGAEERGSEWAIVQRELEEQRERSRQEAREKAEGKEEMSLFAILQANKAEKQTAFEEAAKFKNQFRALNDDEIEFLDEVRETQRKEEEKVKNETEERLMAFRELRAKAAGSGGSGEGGKRGGGGEWDNVGRKRKREGNAGVLGLGLLKKGTKKGKEGGKGEVKVEVKDEVEVKEAPVLKKGLGGLVDYGSDSD